MVLALRRDRRTHVNTQIEPGPPAPPIRTPCPFLGVRTDRRTQFAFVSEHHRCYKTGQGRSVDVDAQQRFCLDLRHADCPVYRDLSRSGPIPSTSRRVALAVLGPVAGVVAAASIGGALLLSRSVDSSSAEVAGNQPEAPALIITASAGAASAGPTSSARSAVTAVATAAAINVGLSTSPTAEPARRPSSTPVATASPTRAAGAAATRAYTVQPGDSLSDISARFGTSIQTLLTLNRLREDQVITIGQVLQVPTPAGVGGSPSR